MTHLQLKQLGRWISAASVIGSLAFMLAFMFDTSMGHAETVPHTSAVPACTLSSSACTSVCDEALSCEASSDQTQSSPAPIPAAVLPEASTESTAPSPLEPSVLVPLRLEPGAVEVDPSTIAPQVIAPVAPNRTVVITPPKAQAPARAASPRVVAPAGAVPRVLLVGNSYTHFHMLHRLIERIAASAGNPLRVDAITHGGYSLRMHWLNPATRARVTRGGYRFVVLQDHSLRPVDHPDEFAEFGERFARAASGAGAQPVFYQTWARSPRSRFYLTRTDPRDSQDMTARLEAAYDALGLREGALVAPVGSAFEAALTGKPELELYGRDGAHPSWAGSYLAACVLYSTLTHNDPRAASYAPFELPSDQAQEIRELAAVVTGR